MRGRVGWFKYALGVGYQAQAKFSHNITTAQSPPFSVPVNGFQILSLTIDFYSERSDFTGLANAARTLSKLTVSSATPTAHSPASAITPQPTVVR